MTELLVSKENVAKASSARSAGRQSWLCLSTLGSTRSLPKASDDVDARLLVCALYSVQVIKLNPFENLFKPELPQ